MHRRLIRITSGNQKRKEIGYVCGYEPGTIWNGSEWGNDNDIVTNNDNNNLDAIW